MRRPGRHELNFTATSSWSHVALKSPREDGVRLQILLASARSKPAQVPPIRFRLSTSK